MKVPLKQIKNEYNNWILKKYGKCGKKNNFNVDTIIEISSELFREFKIEELENIDDKECDMFLFQYGTYDWGKGKFFEFDITRQFILPEEDEPYQLALTLSFEPIDCKDYNCWSVDFESLEKWIERIRETDGYKMAKDLTSKKFKMTFEQC